MAKSSTVFFCNSCGYESPKWLGKCPACNEWNTFLEEKVVKDSGRNKVKKISEVLSLNTISKTEINRIKSGFSELDRVLRWRFCKRFLNFTSEVSLELVSLL